MSDQSTTNQQEEILDDILPEFLVEADDLLESLNELLLQLDEGVKAQSDLEEPVCDKELLNEVFRSAHTLKGLSGMFGFTDINQLTHKVENIFDAARSDNLPVNEDIVDVIFRAIDHVSAMVEGLRNGETGGVDAEAIQSEIQNLLEATGTVKPEGGKIDLEAAFAEIEADTESATEEATSFETTTDLDLEAAFAKAKAEHDQAQSETSNTEIVAEEESEVESIQEVNTSEVEDQLTDVAAEATSTTQSAEVDSFADEVDDENIPANYLSIFIDETEASLDSLTEILLDGVDEKIAEHLLVICHRIKGSAASIGLNRAAALGHVMEDLLQDLEEENRQPSAEMADALLSCIDALRGHVNDLKQGTAKVFEFESAYQQLIAARDNNKLCAAEVDSQKEPQAQANVESQEVESEITSEEKVEEENPESTNCEVEASAVEVPQEPSTQAMAANFSEAPSLEPSAEAVVEDKPKVLQEFESESLTKIVAATPPGTNALAVQVELRPELLLVGLKARLLFEKLSQYGKVFFCEPVEEELDDLEELSLLTMGVSTNGATEEIQTNLSVEGVLQVLIESISKEVVDAKPSISTESKAEMNDDSPTSNDHKKELPEAVLKKAEETSVASTQVASSKGPTPQKSNNKPSATKSSVSNSIEPTSKPAETVRVDIDRLDQLMNLAGQLVINKARFSQINASMKRSTGSKSNTNTINEMMRSVEQLRHGFENCSDQNSFAENYDSMQSYLRRVHTSMEMLQHQFEHYDDVRLSVNDLSEAVHQLDRVADGIQKGVMDTRMVPIGPLFGRFKRVIRDISHSSGKKIRLEIRGENTELDKRMIDELGDPLIHIVRNSADHGIESPEERTAAGKPAEGTVILDASHRGNSIVIEIIDDGKGLDTERIRKKAIEKGVVSESDADKLTDHQVHQLIWEPGFSTAEQVTNVSGRGMGMDIVRSKIDEINGVVEMHSKVGEGTKIAIKLPLTLAILPSLLAEIEGDVFAIPVESVSEIVSLAPGDLFTVHNVPTATVRGNTISVVYLSNLFSWSHPAKHDAAITSETEETILVIVESEGEQLGLIVDSLLGEEDIVIKSLAENYQNVDGVAGASILGDGRVSLILDTNAMLVAASGQAELQQNA